MLGIQYQKDEETNKWYTDLITKSNLIEYTDVSGCYILKPKAQFMWDAIRAYMDIQFKKRGVRNASFPLFIPESLLLKEQEHVAGFAPEVAWVTEAGNSKLSERLAIRPTSEAIMYPAYAKWIRSHKDLPIMLNQWCSVVRWEFKNPVPFLRSREFHWQEGHSAFATKKEAEKEARDILAIYQKTYEQLLAIPCIIGRKSDGEKFAGADYSLSCEIFLPTGKAIQGCTSHHLGQHFSKAFGITFTDDKMQPQHAWQNSWGFTTRSLGIAVMMHSDSKGLVIPPRIAENKIVIIPILTKEDNTQLLAFAESVFKQLKAFSPILDTRDYSPGWKFNDAELNGVPLRIELGQKELAEQKVTIVRRDTLQRETLLVAELKKKIPELLDTMHTALFERAKAFLNENIVDATTLAQIVEQVQKRKIVKTVFDGSKEAEEIIKEKTGGKTLVIPFGEKPAVGSVCPFTGKAAKHVIYIAKSL